MADLKPVFDKIRTKCPFYGFGFNRVLEVMKDSGGNQCAIITGSYSPCQMEMAEQTPSWSECPFNTEAVRDGLAGILREVKIFPNEFRPPQQRWDGISLESWVRYITDEVPIEG